MGGDRVFTSVEDLREYLVDLNPNYRKYAQPLWDDEFTSISQLAHAETQALRDAGVTKSAHVSDIKARADAALKAAGTGIGAGPSVAMLQTQSFAPGPGIAPGVDVHGLLKSMQQGLAQLTLEMKGLPSAVLAALQQQRLGELPVIRKAISQATSGTLQRVTERIQCRLSMVPWPGTASDAVAPPAFQWPLDARGAEDEVAGYQRAKEWWDEHLVPPDQLRLVLNWTQTSWMKCTPAPGVEITGGGTDALLVLEEEADELEVDKGNVLGRLLTICGQVEYKTVHALSTKGSFNGEFSKAGLEHICATYLQEGLITQSAIRLDKDVTALPERHFCTIMTDNNDGWALFTSQPGAVCYMESRPSASKRNAAIDHIKTWLLKAAKSQRAVLQALQAPQGPRHDEAGTWDEGPDDTQPNAAHGQSSTELCHPSAPPQAGGTGKVAPSSHRQSSQPSSMRGVQHQRQGDVRAQYDQRDRLRNVVEELPQDDDFMRQLGAGYHRLLTNFLRTEIGYRDLLGLDAPPSTLQLPDVETLLTQPLSAQPRLVCAAMQQVLGKEQQDRGEAAQN